MTGLFKTLEGRLRAFRRRLSLSLSSGRRGRKLLLDSLSPSVTSMTLDCGDHVISFSPHELVGRRIYVEGHFERDRVEEVLDVLTGEKLLPAGGATVLEIGANIGTQTVYFCKSGRVRRLLAVEPDPRNLRLLRRNIDDNGLAAMAKVVAAAVGDFDGKAQLHMSASNHGQSSLVRAAPDSASVEVDVRPMPAILAEADLDPGDVSLIWMDIEGAEPMACRSMASLLERKVPLMMEFSPDLYGRQGTADFIAFLSAHYPRCIHFGRGARRQIAPAQLTGEARQSDILLLP